MEEKGQLEAISKGSVIMTFTEDALEDLFRIGQQQTGRDYRRLMCFPNGEVISSKLKPHFHFSDLKYSDGTDTPLVWLQNVLKNIEFFKKNGFKISIETRDPSFELLEDLKFTKNGKNRPNHKLMHLHRFSGNRLVIKGSKGEVVLSCDTGKRDRIIRLDKIMILEQRKGLGTKLMTILTRVTKGLDIVIELSAAPLQRDFGRNVINYEKGVSSSKLKQFYEKQGFRVSRVIGSGESALFMMDTRKQVDNYYA